jgi:hypothetical protein
MSLRVAAQWLLVAAALSVAACSTANDAAKLGRDPVRFECKQPVRAYVAFLGAHPDWARPTAEWTRYMSGYRVINTDADIYWREFPAGRSQIGFKKGTYVLLGFAKADGPAPKTHASDVRTEFLQRRLEADGATK